LLHFTEINISEHKSGEHYFSMLAELNEYGFQFSAWSLSGLNWSTMLSTKSSISDSQGPGCTLATRDSTLNSCSIESLLVRAEF